MDNIPMTDTKDLILEINKATDLIKKQAEITHTEIKNLGKITDETKLNTDKLFSEHNARLTELEQKSQRLIQHSANPQDLGSSITSSPEFKSIQEKGSAWHGTQQFTFDQKAITSQSATGVATATALVTPYHVPGIIAPPNRPLLIRDLLMPGRTNSSSIWYGEESLFENNADFVAENPSTSKPESKLEFTSKIANVTTLAHLARASNQILADSPALQSYINERLVYGLNFKEDEALLHGDGSGITIKGLMPSSTPYQKPRGVNITSETFIDRLRLAMLQASLAGYPPTAHILSPIDWTNIVLTKDSMNQYIFADATGSTGKMLWGLPVIETLSMTAGKFLTGAFRFAAQIYDRDEITVTLATQNRDDFEKNMVTILAEKRLALCIYRPQALVNGSFSDEETQETTKTK